MKEKLFFIILFIFLLHGCSSSVSNTETIKIGLLLPNTIEDQGLNSKAYQGLINIHTNLGVDVSYHEEIDSLSKVERAIREFSKNEVKLVFGHGQLYAEYFMEIKDEYPDIHFVSFNGIVNGHNITSLHFEGHSMGFFAGMVASEMSESDVIGVLTTFPLQPEVEGFVEGASYQNRDVRVIVDFVANWLNVDEAIKKHNNMVMRNADVFYPAGDSYHIPIIEEVKRQGLYAIGYVSDHSDLGQSTVLTSTVQHVDELYLLVAEKFLNNELLSGNLSYGFSDGVISLGDFSPDVPEQLQKDINDAIQEYIESGNLPNVKK